LQYIVIEFAIASSYKIVGYGCRVLYKICRHRGRHQTVVTTDSSSNLHPPRPQACGKGDRAARRWRSPLASGGARAPVDLCHRWSRTTGGGSRSSVEEPVRRWSPFTGGVHTLVEPRAGRGAHSLVGAVEELARWCLNDWLQEGADGGGAEP
jgi:hypothetical protein